MKLKFTFFAIISLSLVANLFASDTTRVNVHNNTQMVWYGNYDAKALFPEKNSSIKYRKILMHYIMGCATAGCSDWDYTTKIEALHKPGTLDSTLVIVPSFKVDEQVKDSLSYSETPTFSLNYNDNTGNIDTIYKTSLQVIFYSDNSNPTTPTDTIYVYPTNYYYYLFNSGGEIEDSVYVPSQFTIYATFNNYYTYFEKVEKYELARVITPYGGYMRNTSNGYNNQWTHDHVFDVTDFEPILHDSLTIRCFYDGWSSGFSATIYFEFIEGIPAREVVNIRNIYQGGFTYNNSNHFETNYLPEKAVQFTSNTIGARLKITPSGHGFDNSTNCAEFCIKTYNVKIDGTQRFSNQMWRNDCGLNPIYPQGGTWLADRANWCPGLRTNTFEHELTPFITTGNSHNLDLSIQAYNWSGTQAPYYYIETQLVEYGAPNFTNDVEIEEIISPSKGSDHLRKNPICGKPVVKIKNNGSTTLTSATIQYGIVGETPQIYSWTGNLPFTQSAIVELPVLSNWGNAIDLFEVKVSAPNGTTDEYAANDTMRSVFNRVPIYEADKFIMEIRSNNAASETSWKLEAPNGTVLYSRNPTTANTTFRDTLTLADGCYVFRVTDTGKNGLSYWANSAGSGFVRIRKYGSNLTHITFRPDFGTSIVHHFNVSAPLGVKKEFLQSLVLVDIYPNPANENIKIEIEQQSVSDVEIIISDIMGREMKRIFNSKIKDTVLDIDLSEFENGIYLVKVSTETGITTRKMVVEK